MGVLPNLVQNVSIFACIKEKNRWIFLVPDTNSDCLLSGKSMDSWREWEILIVYTGVHVKQGQKPEVACLMTEELMLWLIYWLSYLLIDWFTDKMTELLIEWLDDWWIKRLTVNLRNHLNCFIFSVLSNNCHFVWTEQFKNGKWWHP